MSDFHSKPLQACTVAIAGLGLMGGSLGLALQGKAARVVGIARRRETLRQALAMGAIDEGHETLAAGVSAADIVVLATPVGIVLQQIAELGKLARGGGMQPGAVVLDLGSTKEQVCRALATLPDIVEPVGCHPMCGKETSGIEVAEAGLYQGAPFVITPLPHTRPQTVALVTELALAIGSRPIELDAARHDRLVAAISHLPYLLSVAFFAAVDDMAQDDDMVWRLAAGGFRSATRLAGSDVTMMLDILFSNQANVLALIDTLRQRLDDLEALLRTGDRPGLRFQAERVRGLRAEFLDRHGA